MKSMKNKPIINGVKSLETKYNIKLVHIICIEGFIRIEYGFISQDIMDCILLYYAKTLTLYCQWNDTSFKSGHIWYCLACDNWESILQKIGNLNHDEPVIPRMITIHSNIDNKMYNIFGPAGFNQIANSLIDNQQLLCYMDDTDKPNINRIIQALTVGFAKDKWTMKAMNTNADLVELFRIFLDEEEVN